MTKAKDKAAGNPKVLQVARTKDQTEAQAVAWMAVNPETNAAVVIDAYQSNIAGDDVNLMALIDALRKSTDQSKAGDLSHLEAMLIGQATALQTIFTSLARRAHHQTLQAHFEAFLGLALKAQAQSRATISALAWVEYWHQSITFAFLTGDDEPEDDPFVKELMALVTQRPGIKLSEIQEHWHRNRVPEVKAALEKLLNMAPPPVEMRKDASTGGRVAQRYYPVGA